MVLPMPRQKAAPPSSPLRRISEQAQRRRGDGAFPAIETVYKAIRTGRLAAVRYDDPPSPWLVSDAAFDAWLASRVFWPKPARPAEKTVAKTPAPRRRKPENRKA